MERSDSAEPVLPTTPLGQKLRSPQEPNVDSPSNEPSCNVFVFNPFAEGYIGRGKAFTPVKHQARLAEELANLPQFLCQPHDVVLVAKRPSADFLKTLQQAGFAVPEFVELSGGRIDPSGSLFQRQFADLRPWAWGPESVKLLAPLFGRIAGEARNASHYFNDEIARLYSKAWSAAFLKKVLVRCRAADEASAPVRRDEFPRVSVPGAENSAPRGSRLSGDEPLQPWLCSEQEAGVAVDTLEEAIAAIDAIRGRGHQRVVVKEAYGVAGHSALRLWEPEVLPQQRQWLVHALGNGRQLVVEPWLERELDFSVQLEMGRHELKLCGFTGLVNDSKGQFLANWAEADYRQRLPAKVAGLLSSTADISARLQRLYGEVFSLLEAELKAAGFVGPIGIDAFVYRTARGECRLKPVVEINPRYTMGRLTLELMKQACADTCGLFRLVSRRQAQAEGVATLSDYARCLAGRVPLRLEGHPARKIRQGALCLTDPGQARVCLASFEVGPTLNLPGLLRSLEPRADLKTCET